MIKDLLRKLTMFLHKDNYKYLTERLKDQSEHNRRLYLENKHFKQCPECRKHHAASLNQRSAINLLDHLN